MFILTSLKNSTLLRAPLLAAYRLVLQTLVSGPKVLRRAVYDAMPVGHLVVGTHEKYVVSTSDRTIGRALFLDGEFDLYKLRLALDILRSNGHSIPKQLVDVGANIGSITIPAVRRGWFESATAIEPHPDNVRLLRTNIALNGIEQRVQILALAVGDHPQQTLHLQESKTNSGNHTISTQGTPVRSTTLDSLLDPEADILLWMDIEGYEGHALKGAERLMAAGCPLVAEFNHSYMCRSGGLEKFLSVISGCKIYDLRMPHKESNISELLARYSHTSEFTDILVMHPARGVSSQTSLPPA